MKKMVKNKYNLIAFLARPVGVEVFKVLAQSEKFAPSLLLTHEYEKKALNDGKKIERAEVKEFKELAKKYNVPFFMPSKKEMINTLNNKPHNEYDFFISVNSIFLFPEEIIKKAGIAALNMHPSIVKNKEMLYKGADPIERAFNNKDKEIGVCIHKLIEKIDGGEILGYKTLKIVPGTRMENLNDRLEFYKKLSPLYSSLIIETLEKLVKT